MHNTSSTIGGARANKMDVRKLVTMAMLTAIGVILVTVCEIPIFPAAPFLKYDPADIPILIGTLIYGPAAGLILTVLVSFIQSFMVHGSGGVIGFVMHVCATGAMVLVVGLICRAGLKKSTSGEDDSAASFSFHSPSRKRAAVSLSFGTLSMTIMMIGLNLVLTPIFMGAPVEAVLKMLVPVIIPFNLIKAGINCVVAFLVYKYVEKLVKRAPQ